MGLLKVTKQGAVSICSGCGGEEEVPFEKMLVGNNWVRFPKCSLCGTRSSTYFAVPCSSEWEGLTAAQVERYIAAQALHKWSIAKATKDKDWDEKIPDGIHNAVDENLEVYTPTVHSKIAAIQKETPIALDKIAELTKDALEAMRSRG